MSILSVFYGLEFSFKRLIYFSQRKQHELERRSYETQLNKLFIHRLKTTHNVLCIII